MLLTVLLLSGREVTLDVDESCSIYDLLKRAQKALGVGLGRLTLDAKVLLKSMSIAQAGLKENDTLTATVRPNASQLAASSAAFACLREDGSVVCWGHPDAGGECQVLDQLVDPWLNLGLSLVQERNVLIHPFH